MQIQYVIGLVLLIASRVNCDTACDPNSAPTSSLQFCTDSTCTKFTTTPNIHLNDDIYLLHKITTAGLQGYTLANSSVFYESTGLLKYAQLETVSYSAGQAIYLIEAIIVWGQLSIEACAILVPPKRILSESNMRINQEATAQDTIQATIQLNCIKLKGKDKCPTCYQICIANYGDAPPGCRCSGTHSFSSMALLSLLLILLF